MKINTIRWSGELTWAIGRNGFIRCSGVEIYTTSDKDKTLLRPITSKGGVGRCEIVVPTEQLAELAMTLLDHTRKD